MHRHRGYHQGWQGNQRPASAAQMDGGYGPWTDIRRKHEHNSLPDYVKGVG